jgi:hypothetical protein
MAVSEHENEEVLTGGTLRRSKNRWKRGFGSRIWSRKRPPDSFTKCWKR